MKSFFKLREQTARERWAKEASERQKKHDEIEAKRVAAAKQGKENMSGAIDKLSHVLYKEETSLEEAKIGDKVQVTHGSQKGLVGHVGEIRKGIGGNDHTYTVDYDDNGKRSSVQVKKAHAKVVNEVRSEYSKAAHDEDGRALGIRPGSKPEHNPVVKHEVNHYQGKHYISVIHKSGMSYSHKDASGNTQNFASKEAAEKKAAELNKSIKEMVEELKRAVND